MDKTTRKNNAEELIAAVDLGTTSLKIAVFTAEGEMAGAASLEYSLYTPERCIVESDPDMYMDAVEKGFRIMKTQGICMKNITAWAFPAKARQWSLQMKTAGPSATL